MRNWLPLAIPAWLLACTDPSPIEQAYGPVLVTVETEGGDQDLNGYRVIFDDEQPGKTLSPASSVVQYLPVGEHHVEIVDVHDNCDVTGETRRPVTAVKDVVTRVEFDVLCHATGIALTTVTQGVELDPNGYDVLITGQAGRTLPVNGSLIVGRQV